jgi:hypothetical protein
MSAHDEIMRLDMISKETWDKILALVDTAVELPEVTDDDNGKVLTVVDGA